MVKWVKNWLPVGSPDRIQAHESMSMERIQAALDPGISTIWLRGAAVQASLRAKSLMALEYFCIQLV
jgi:hypothetical protein